MKNTYHGHAPDIGYGRTYSDSSARVRGKTREDDGADPGCEERPIEELQELLRQSLQIRTLVVLLDEYYCSVRHYAIIVGILLANYRDRCRKRIFRWPFYGSGDYSVQRVVRVRANPADCATRRSSTVTSRICEATA